MAVPLVLEQRTSGLARVVTGAAGLVPLMAPYELGPHLWPPTAADLLLVPVVVGAVALSGALLGIAALGPVTTWTVDADGLGVHDSAGRWSRRRHVGADRVREAEIVEDRDDAPTWYVVVRPTTGRPVKFPAGPTRDDAEALRRRILDALGPDLRRTPA